MSKVLSLASVVAAGLAIAGCGGGGGTNLAVFTGTWSYVAGSYVVSCPSTQGASSTSLIGERVSLARAVSGASLAYQTTFSSCLSYFDARGNSATLAPTAACQESGTSPDYGDYDVLVTPISWLLTVTGTTMTESSSANLAYTVATGESFTCTGSITGATLTKVTQ